MSLVTNLLSNFDINSDVDFFEQNPQFKIEFSSVQDKYKDNYTQIMWALVLDQHPKSIYRNLDQETRRSQIEADYLAPIKIDWEILSDEIIKFKNLVLTKKEKFLVEWERKLEERQNFINALPYNSETYELLDKMMASTDKMWKQYLSCLKDVEEEETKQTVEGNARESISEQNLI